MSSLIRLLTLSVILLLILVAAGLGAQAWLRQQEQRILTAAESDLREQVEAAIALTGGRDAPLDEARLAAIGETTGTQLLQLQSDPSSGERDLSAMQVAVPWKENAWLVGTHPAPAGERVHSLLQRVLLALGVFALLLAVALVILMAVRPLGRGGDTRAPFHRVKEDMRSLSTLARNTVRQQEELNQERDERMRAEQESNQRLQLLNRALEEKIRMGRDLHDGVIQSLYAAGLSLQAARNTMAAEPEEAGQRMDAGLSLINRTIGDIRSYISGLSPRSVRHDSLAQSLREIVEDLRAGRPVDLELKINDKAAAALSDDQLAETMQISHEAVSNALRHGGAERILIALSPAEGGVDLTIRDNGKGFDPTHTRSGGHGLANIRARVERCAGRLQIDSSSGQGTCLQILWPSTTTS